MGKKPVVTMIGLVWAGIALTGCGDCCKNCRNKSCGAPAVASRNATMTPTMIGDARPASTATNPLPPKIDTAMGGSTTSTIQPAGATAPAAPAPITAPSTQSSLASPAIDTATATSGNPLPSRMDDGLPAASASRLSTSSTTEMRRVPPVPVLPKSSDTDSAAIARPADSAAGQTLPKLGSTNPTPPAAPASSEALPPLSGGSSLPPLPN